MGYKTTARNMSGIQHQTVREKVDDKFNEVHDRLSAAYYEGGIFVQGENTWDFGKLKSEDPEDAKTTFDKLHGLIFYHREVEFNRANLALPKKQRIAADKYDTIFDDAGSKTGSKADLAQSSIEALENEGIKLVI